MTAEQTRCYLDHNATSPLRPEAREALLRALDETPANPSSLHGEGRRARATIERAREQVAALVGTASREIVFTSGGTEAIAAAVRGVCDRAPTGLRRIVTSTIEHSAVLEAVRHAERCGFEVTRVGCDGAGRVDAAAFVERLDGGVALAALQWANNETGVVQPVEEVGAACRRAGVPFFVDAVQAAGKIRVEPRAVSADLLALSAHKLGGPQGAGALVVREGIVLAPLIAGGAQEKRRRGGTEPVAAIAGFGAAAEAARTQMPREAESLMRLRAKLESRLRKLFPGVRFHGQEASRLPSTVNFALPGVSGETVVIALDLVGIAVSTGSACSSGAVEPSHVIRAMGFDEAESRGAVRVSLGWSSRPEHVDRFLEALPAVVRRARDQATDPI